MQVAASHNIGRRNLERRFYTFWFIDIPHHINSFRIYDQIFIDGTYTKAGSLLIAATRFHVLNWVWPSAKPHRPTSNYVDHSSHH